MLASSDNGRVTIEPPTINLAALHQEIAAELEQVAQRYFALRGQLQLIERILAETQRGAVTGAPLGEQQP